MDAFVYIELYTLYIYFNKEFILGRKLKILLIFFNKYFFFDTETLFFFLKKKKRLGLGRDKKGFLREQGRDRFLLKEALTPGSGNLL